MADQPKQKAYFVLQTFKQGIQKAANLMKTMLPSDIETETCVIGTKTDVLADIVKQGDSIVVVGAPVGIVNWNGKAEKWIKEFNNLVVKQQKEYQEWQKKSIEAEKKRKAADAKLQEKKGKGRDLKVAEPGEKKEGSTEAKMDASPAMTEKKVEDHVKKEENARNSPPPVWKGIIAVYYTVDEEFASDSYNEKIMNLVLNLDMHKHVLADFLSVPLQKDSDQLAASAQASIKGFVNKILDKRPGRAS